MWGQQDAEWISAPDGPDIYVGVVSYLWLFGQNVNSQKHKSPVATGLLCLALCIKPGILLFQKLLDLLRVFSFYDQIVIAGRQGLNVHRKVGITIHGFVLLVQDMTGGIGYLQGNRFMRV